MSSNAIELGKMIRVLNPPGSSGYPQNSIQNSIIWSDVEIPIINDEQITTNSDPPGLTIIPTFDSSITTDPNSTAIQAAINAAISEITSLITDNITVNIKFVQVNTGLGMSSTFISTMSYSTQFYPILATKQPTSDHNIAYASLPPTSPLPLAAPNDTMTATLPFLRLFGIPIMPPPGDFDSTIGLNISICNLTRTSVDPSKYDLQSVVLHEMDEVLGTSSALSQPPPAAIPSSANPADFFRYSALNVRSFDNATDTAPYFSIDSGATDIANYNHDGVGDYGDWLSPNESGVNPTEPIRVQNAYALPGGWVDLVNPYGSPTNPWIANPPPLTGGIIIGKSPELRMLNVIGYTLDNSVICIHPDMLVETRTGIKKISQIVKGDEVKTYDDVYMPVIYNLSFDSDKHFCKLSKNCFGVDHPNQDFYIHSDHPIIYEGKETVPIDLIGKVDGVEKVVFDEPITVYSLCTQDRTVFKISGNLMVYTWSEKDWFEYSTKNKCIYLTQ